MKSNQRTQALAAGISLIVMALSATFSFGYVLSPLEVQTDPTAAYKHLISNEGLYKLGLAGWLLIFLTDLVVTVSLYFFFRGTNNRLSTLTAFFRFSYTLVLGIALTSLFSMVALMDEQVLDVESAGAQVISALASFETIWSLGLIIFGLHLLGLAYLCIGKDRMPNFFGYLLLFAGFGYLVVHGLRALPLLPDHAVDAVESILMLPMALGEILLAIWLLVKGGRINKKNE